MEIAFCRSDHKYTALGSLLTFKHPLFTYVNTGKEHLNEFMLTYLGNKGICCIF